MEENFDGQPAIPPRINMELVSINSQTEHQESTATPQVKFMDESFVKGLNQIVAKVTGEEEELKEEKIYQPLIPPRRYEEGCEEKESVYQSLTVATKSQDNTDKKISNLIQTPIDPSTESHYQPLTRRTEESVYERAFIPNKENSVNIPPSSSNSENHYQPINDKRVEDSVYEKITVQGREGYNDMQSVSKSESQYQPLLIREEPRRYQTVTVKSDKMSPATERKKAVPNNSESVYQALSRGQEENTYQSLIIHREQY